MGFWFLGFLALTAMAFLFWFARGREKAGENRVKARQAEGASEARRDAQDAEARVGSMSDDDVSDRLRDRWSRD